MAVEILEQPQQSADILLEANPFARLHQVGFSHAPELGVVEQQVGQFAALLHQANVRESRDFFVKSVNAEQLAQDHTGIVETQSLIEVADE